ncbi:unnamed protein product [Zymoseptoria tritici ST99CH_1A5]|uniref:Cell division control protein n=2 Tax=Zymoseptoria tritici TaxID=1047171 RepID=A0A2H1GPA4_ZYMTR|nr:unnamed protein product [Zymoseptoria tritici ST99CH_1E4]SMR57799.1 unnamed protein product [Zymoseptoria tritici ST99CH_3D1]SMY26234.1 unnamed protein product [Zymoseptoria tritici ST99CH_1A5]
MSSTILGKRTRSAANTATTTLEPAKRVSSISATTTTTTRAKRRTTVNDSNDENENPFITTADENENEEEQERPAKKRGSFKAATIGENTRIATPTTPRHRNALSKKIPVTPSRHGTLFARGQLTPRSPRTPRTPGTATSVYNQARQIFTRSSNPGKLVGRDEERAQLSEFISTASAAKSTGCLYVSGPPGTGKSALLDEVIREHTEDGKIPLSVVNCMSVRNAKDLSQKLAEDLDLQEEAGFDYLKSCFVRGKARDTQKYLVVLDEVDRLVDLDLELLYSLFEWSMTPSSRLILIGIANALDLTDRFLPRLKSRNLKPELLPFMPYSAAQIAEVITSKLKSIPNVDADTVPFLHPAAILFCAKKVASQTGDLRKAFDICRRAIELIDGEVRSKELVAADSPSKLPLGENLNLSSSPSKPQPVFYTASTAPKATIAHMAKATSQAFSNGAVQRLSSLNLQQKAVLCALAATEKRAQEAEVPWAAPSTPSKSQTSAPTIKALFETYTTLCKKEHLFHPLSSAEFRDVVSGLETLSLVSAIEGSGKGGSFGALMTPVKTPGKGRKGGWATGTVGDERRMKSAVGVKELMSVVEKGVAGELLREMVEGGRS